MLFLCASVSFADTFDPKAATMDELLAKAVRYGNTEERRTLKEQARQELFTRKPESFRFLMEKIHLDNVEVQVLAQEMIDQMTADQAVPVLLDFVRSEEPPSRRIAVYFLGFYPAGSTNAPLVEPFLAEEKARNAAIRTLGKWRDTNATLSIAALIEDPKERTRVAAANALRDIGDLRGIPALVAALNDPMFTVRNTAERALLSFNSKAENHLLDALPHAKDPALRPIIHLLAAMKSQRAYKQLKDLSGSADPYVRADAKQALRGIRAPLIDRIF
jgi:HEAT repeat protein